MNLQKEGYTTDFICDIKSSVHSALTYYYANIGNKTPNNMHHLVLSQVEPAVIMATLRYTLGNQAMAARILGMSRGWFLMRCQQYDIHLSRTFHYGYHNNNEEH